MSVANKTITTPVRLYRHLLKCLRNLPDGARTHYKHQIKQAFRSHADESSPERIQQIINRAMQDIEWLVKKYTS